MGTAHPLIDEAEELRQESAEVERLLDEVRAKAGPGTWPLVEQVLHRVISLYAGGLERLLSHAVDAGVMPETFRDRLCSDELVSSLLVLHGLHPLSTEERVRRALDRVRPYLGSHAGDVELLGVNEGGAARLRLLGTCSHCASSQATVENLLRRSIEEAAPEITDVHVEGAKKPAAEAGSLVPLKVKRESAGPRPLWTVVEGLEDLVDGATRLVDVTGTRILAIRHGESLLAYRDGCADCGESLEQASMQSGVLTCPACQRRYEVSRAGRPVDGHGRSLHPVPLLSNESGVRVSLVGVS
jgi:Fe-S cluster biogenesis protein NfuA/nitrite reductase/ring-hydroxylating ferredoxin subunit